jgi:hypothetical protein
MTLLLSLTKDEAAQLFAEATEASPEGAGAAARVVVPEEQVWSLSPLDFGVYRCDRCGAALLRAGVCCDAPVRPESALYYVPATSRASKDRIDFSVIMPVKNKLHLTQAAVESLRRARGDHSLEFVFVDCCSTDGSVCTPKTARPTRTWTSGSGGCVTERRSGMSTCPSTSTCCDPRA